MVVATLMVFFLLDDTFFLGFFNFFFGGHFDFFFSFLERQSQIKAQPYH